MSITATWNTYYTRLLVCFFLVSNALLSQPVLKFSDAKKNFGFVKQGKQVELKFELTNTGDQPLILSDYKVECSCTVVTLPKAPVLPKQKAEVIVQFDTKTVYDRQDRVVQIFSNASNNPQKIRFKGVVLK
ncbi:MAG: Lipoprotein [Bacteroidetes bacterium]|jgi:hypothetical protein|nr:Lipoprotein [Bacteroidota bacterium]